MGFKAKIRDRVPGSQIVVLSDNWPSQTPGSRTWNPPLEKDLQLQVQVLSAIVRHVLLYYYATLDGAHCKELQNMVRCRSRRSIRVVICPRKLLTAFGTVGKKDLGRIFTHGNLHVVC